MSNTISVGLRLGAVLDNAFTSVFGSASSTVSRLGRTTELLSQRQQRLGQIMSRALSHPTRNVQQLRNHYERLGQSLDRLKAKQNSLNAAMAKQKALGDQRQALGGEMMGTAATAWANARLVRESVGRSANFQDSLRDARIKGTLSAEDEGQIGKIIRDTLKNKSTTQDHMELSNGIGQLVEGEASLEEIRGYAPLLGKAVTGLRISMDDGAATFLALRDMGIDGEEGMRQALDQLIWSGQQGGYGMANLFNAIGQLGDDIKTNKLGIDSLGDIAATLQIGDGIMGAENAMAGLKGWLKEMNTDKRAAAFSSAYKTIDPNAEFDYQASMKKAVANGYSEFEASMKIASGFLEKRLGSAGMAEMDKYKGNIEKQAELMEKFGLSEIFKDSNQINMVLGYRQNKDEFDRIREGGKSSGESTDTLQKTADLRMDSPIEKFKSLANTLKELSITVGDALLPPVLQLVDTVQPILGNITEWIAANPKLVVGLVGAATAIVGLKVATLGASWGMNFFIKSPMAALNVALKNSSAKLELFRAKMLLGSATGSKFSTVFPGIAASVTTLGKVFASVGRMMFLSPIGLVIGGIAVAALLIYKYWQPIKAFFSGVFEGIAEAVEPIGATFSEVFGPVGELFQPLVGWISQAWDWVTKLLEPVNSTAEELEGAKNAGKSFGRVIGQAINILLIPLKTALKLIGWVTDGIKNGFAWSPMETIKNAWSGVTGWFGSTWDTITGSVSTGIQNASDNITAWSPLSIFKNIFSSVLNWFGVELPTSFTSMGQAILDGLINGITSKATAVKESIMNVGSSVSGWFKEQLGINSPSRVFIGFGENISEGAAIGINNQSELVGKAALDLASATDVKLASPSIVPPNLLNNHVPNIQPPGQDAIRAQQFANQPSGMVVTYAPHITVKGGADVAAEVNRALRMSFSEFERLMKEYEHRANRSAYKGIDK
ncbi:phage tail tape measure protein [Budviciaceae bacterium BWR-B9]|uniref:Phage tail tape measure protein n=1 Tax=Limnobaculum allomyrinae TaxID=2791986 RepID=A0ABS1IVZ5_9GAMM|nr:MULTISPECIES: phage tail tape measure protein [Limnobaculum]MBK5145935.1 phage tail tape measure protein [Limnobaculum allomyrinae]MBV7694010.1 phage tail tape measure protein [Limnobaculum sp. M2-1]